MSKDPKDKIRVELDQALTSLTVLANQKGLLDDKVIKRRLTDILSALKGNRLSQAKTLVEGFDTVLNYREQAKQKEEEQKKKEEELKKKQEELKKKRKK